MLTRRRTGRRVSPGHLRQDELVKRQIRGRFAQPPVLQPEIVRYAALRVIYLTRSVFRPPNSERQR
jgi:hypothetical protein